MSSVRALFDAIDRHDLSALRAALASGADPNATADALHPETEEELQADLLRAERPGLTALHSAVGALAEGGSIEAVQLLLAAGAHPDGTSSLSSHPTDGRRPMCVTPLLMASRRDEKEAIRLLVDAGASPDVVDDEGYFPIGCAVSRRDWDTVALLVRAGANSTLDHWSLSQSQTALCAAASQLNLPMIRLLLDAGADPSVCDDDYLTPLASLPPRTPANSELYDAAARLLVGATGTDRPHRS